MRQALRVHESKARKSAEAASWPEGACSREIDKHEETFCELNNYYLSVWKEEDCWFVLDVVWCCVCVAASADEWDGDEWLLMVG